MKGLIIVGPGKHFRKEIAERFGKEGFSIGLIGRNEERLSELKRFLEMNNVNCFFEIADVTDKSQISESIKKISEKLLNIGCLIYNVKSSSNVDGIKKDFEVNVLGALNVINSCKGLFSNNFNLIITGGGFKDNPDFDRLGLSLSKAALHNLFLALRPKLIEDNVLLKTLVVDGYVRENGPLFPKDIAEQFWKLYNSDQSYLKYSI